jgi:hypothetical protein
MLNFHEVNLDLSRNKKEREERSKLLAYWQSELSVAEQYEKRKNYFN